MYIYHVLINALSAHMIHINLNIFYTHVEHSLSSTKTIYIKYYKKKKNALQTHTHIDCSRNWVLILVRMEILWEEEGFLFASFGWLRLWGSPSGGWENSELSLSMGSDLLSNNYVSPIYHTGGRRGKSDTLIHSFFFLFSFKVFSHKWY